MELTGDLSREELEAALPGRPIRTYPALLSTEADAVAWARAGAPAGATVVADYQVSPRGRGGRPWQVSPGRGLAFSVVLRPRLSPEREGWMYTVAASALADASGEGAAIEWPDQVVREGAPAGAVGVQVQLGPDGANWAVVNLLVPEVEPPRGGVLRTVLDALQARVEAPARDVLADYLPRCRTLGREVCARLVPLGPSGPQVAGRAATSLKDGALVIETDEGRRVAVRPQHLGVLEDLAETPAP